jgi:hypothetical protein
LKLLILAAAMLATLVVLVSCAKSNDGMAMEDVEMAPEVSDKNNSSGSSLPSFDEKGEMADDAEGGEDVGGQYAPKIIKTATLSAETKDFSSAVSEIEAKVKTLGGYIESCNIQNMNYSYSGSTYSTRNASYVLRIPADKLDTFLSEAGELLNVTSSSTNAEDVSGEYYDIEARINVLETERELVEKMLSEAKDINTMIDLERRLYDIIYEIESYKTAIKVYDSKIAYSTVSLNVREVADLTDLNVDDSFGGRLKRAVKESWKNTVEFAADFIIFLIYAAPFLAVMGAGVISCAVVVIVIAAVISAIVRKVRAKKKKA